MTIGHMFNLHDLLHSFKQSSLHISPKDIVQYGYTDKREIIDDIASSTISMIIDDVINNNVRFQFPTPREAYIQVEGVYGDDFVTARLNGAFQDVEPFESGYTGHKLSFTLNTASRRVLKPVYVNKAKKDIITSKTNAGFKY